MVALPYRSVPAGAKGTVRPAPAAVLTAAQAAIEEGVREAGGNPVSGEDSAIRLARVAYSPDAAADRRSAREKLDAANDAYFGFDLPTARRELEEASNAAARTPQSPEDLQLLSDLLLLKGMIALSSDAAAARDDFDLVVRLTPDKKLDARRYPPHVISAFAAALDRRRNTPVAQVNFESDPPDAIVAIDGELRGRTPLSLDRIEAGQHFYRIEKEGEQPLYGPLRLDPGENPAVWKKLEKADPSALTAPIVSIVTKSADRGQAGPALAALYGADRVVVAAIEPDGPRRYVVEMWWSEPGGATSAPAVKVLPAEPAELTKGLVALTVAVMGAPAFAAPAGGPPAAVRPLDGPALAGDLGLLATGGAGGKLDPPPKAIYQRWEFRAGLGAAAVFSFLAFAGYENSLPGRVNYDVAVKH